MSRKEDNIVKCAKRMTEKLAKAKVFKYNGKYPKAVQVEIDRMLNHCADSHE